MEPAGDRRTLYCPPPPTHHAYDKPAYDPPQSPPYDHMGLCSSAEPRGPQSPGKAIASSSVGEVHVTNAVAGKKLPSASSAESKPQSFRERRPSQVSTDATTEAASRIASEASAEAGESKADVEAAEIEIDMPKKTNEECREVLRVFFAAAAGASQSSLRQVPAQQRAEFNQVCNEISGHLDKYKSGDSKKFLEEVLLANGEEIFSHFSRLVQRPLLPVFQAFRRTNHYNFAEEGSAGVEFDKLVRHEQKAKAKKAKKAKEAGEDELKKVLDEFDFSSSSPVQQDEEDGVVDQDGLAGIDLGLKATKAWWPSDAPAYRLVLQFIDKRSRSRSEDLDKLVTEGLITAILRRMTSSELPERHFLSLVLTKLYGRSVETVHAVIARQLCCALEDRVAAAPMYISRSEIIADEWHAGLHGPDDVEGFGINQMLEVLAQALKNLPADGAATEPSHALVVEQILAPMIRCSWWPTVEPTWFKCLQRVADRNRWAVIQVLSAQLRQWHITGSNEYDIKALISTFVDTFGTLVAARAFPNEVDPHDLTLLQRRAIERVAATLMMGNYLLTDIVGGAIDRREYRQMSRSQKDLAVPLLTSVVAKWKQHAAAKRWLHAKAKAVLFDDKNSVEATARAVAGDGYESALKEAMSADGFAAFSEQDLDPQPAAIVQAKADGKWLAVVLRHHHAGESLAEQLLDQVNTVGYQSARDALLPALAENAAWYNDRVLLILAQQVGEINVSGKADLATAVIDTLRAFSGHFSYEVRMAAVEATRKIWARLKNAERSKSVIGWLSSLSFDGSTGASRRLLGATCHLLLDRPMMPVSKAASAKVQESIRKLVREEGQGFVQGEAAICFYASLEGGNGPFDSQFAVQCVGALAESSQDLVRQKAAVSLVILAAKIDRRAAERDLLPLAHSLAADSSWRVRWTIADGGRTLWSVFGPQVVDDMSALLVDASEFTRAGIMVRIADILVINKDQNFTERALPHLASEFFAKSVLGDDSESVLQSLVRLLPALAPVSAELSVGDPRTFVSTIAAKLSHKAAPVAIRMAWASSVGALLDSPICLEIALSEIEHLSKDKNWRVRASLLEHTLGPGMRNARSEDVRCKLSELTCKCCFFDAVAAVRNAAGSSLVSAGRELGALWQKMYLLPTLAGLAMHKSAAFRISALGIAASIHDDDLVKAHAFRTVAKLARDHVLDVLLQVPAAIEQFVDDDMDNLNEAVQVLRDEETSREAEPQEYPSFLMRNSGASPSLTATPRTPESPWSSHSWSGVHPHSSPSPRKGRKKIGGSFRSSKSRTWQPGSFQSPSSKSGLHTPKSASKGGSITQSQSEGSVGTFEEDLAPLDEVRTVMCVYVVFEPVIKPREWIEADPRICDLRQVHCARL